MISQLRVFEFIIVCSLAKSLYGKSFNKLSTQISTEKDERVKRGYSHYKGNDFDSSVHISSGVLQLAGGDEHSINSDSSSLSAISDGHSSDFDTSLDLSSLGVDHTGSLDSSSHLESSRNHADPWAASGLSTGYELWVEPLPEYHATSTLDSSLAHALPSIASTNAGGDHAANTVFSDDFTHSAHFELPSSQLHTQIASSSSSIGNSALDIGSSSYDHNAISGNIDFNNVADVNTKHYAKSFGK